MTFVQCFLYQNKATHTMSRRATRAVTSSSSATEEKTALHHKFAITVEQLFVTPVEQLDTQQDEKAREYAKFVNFVKLLLTNKQRLNTPSSSVNFADLQAEFAFLYTNFATEFATQAKSVPNTGDSSQEIHAWIALRIYEYFTYDLLQSVFGVFAQLPPPHSMFGEGVKLFTDVMSHLPEWMLQLQKYAEEQSLKISRSVWPTTNKWNEIVAVLAKDTKLVPAYRTYFSENATLLQGYVANATTDAFDKGVADTEAENFKYPSKSQTEFNEIAAKYEHAVAQACIELVKQFEGQFTQSTLATLATTSTTNLQAAFVDGCQAVCLNAARYSLTFELTDVLHQKVASTMQMDADENDVIAYRKGVKGRKNHAPQFRTCIAAIVTAFASSAYAFSVEALRWKLLLKPILSNKYPQQLAVFQHCGSLYHKIDTGLKTCERKARQLFNDFLKSKANQNRKTLFIDPGVALFYRECVRTVVCELASTQAELYTRVLLTCARPETSTEQKIKLLAAEIANQIQTLPLIEFKASEAVTKVGTGFKQIIAKGEQEPSQPLVHALFDVCFLFPVTDPEAIRQRELAASASSSSSALDQTIQDFTDVLVPLQQPDQSFVDPNKLEPEPSNNADAMPTEVVSRPAGNATSNKRSRSSGKDEKEDEDATSAPNKRTKLLQEAIDAVKQFIGNDDQAKLDSMVAPLQRVAASGDDMNIEDQQAIAEGVVDNIILNIHPTQDNLPQVQHVIQLIRKAIPAAATAQVPADPGFIPIVRRPSAAAQAQEFQQQIEEEKKRLESTRKVLIEQNDSNLSFMQSELFRISAQAEQLRQEKEAYLQQVQQLEQALKESITQKEQEIKAALESNELEKKQELEQELAKQRQQLEEMYAKQKAGNDAFTRAEIGVLQDELQTTRDQLRQTSIQLETQRQQYVLANTRMTQQYQEMTNAYQAEIDRLNTLANVDNTTKIQQLQEMIQQNKANQDLIAQYQAQLQNTTTAANNEIANLRAQIDAQARNQQQILAKAAADREESKMQYRVWASSEYARVHQKLREVLKELVILTPNEEVKTAFPDNLSDAITNFSDQLTTVDILTNLHKELDDKQKQLQTAREDEEYEQLMREIHDYEVENAEISPDETWSVSREDLDTLPDSAKFKAHKDDDPEHKNWQRPKWLTRLREIHTNFTQLIATAREARQRQLDAYEQVVQHLKDLGYKKPIKEFKDTKSAQERDELIISLNEELKKQMGQSPDKKALDKLYAYLTMEHKDKLSKLKGLEVPIDKNEEDLRILDSYAFSNASPDVRTSAVQDIQRSVNYLRGLWDEHFLYLKPHEKKAYLDEDKKYRQRAEEIRQLKEQLSGKPQALDEEDIQKFLGQRDPQKRKDLKDEQEAHWRKLLTRQANEYKRNSDYITYLFLSLDFHSSTTVRPKQPESILLLRNQFTDSSTDFQKRLKALYDQRAYLNELIAVAKNAKGDQAQHSRLTAQLIARLLTTSDNIPELTAMLDELSNTNNSNNSAIVTKILQQFNALLLKIGEFQPSSSSSPSRRKSRQDEDEEKIGSATTSSSSDAAPAPSYLTDEEDDEEQEGESIESRYKRRYRYGKQLALRLDRAWPPTHRKILDPKEFNDIINGRSFLIREQDLQDLKLTEFKANLTKVKQDHELASLDLVITRLENRLYKKILKLIESSYNEVSEVPPYEDFKVNKDDRKREEILKELVRALSNLQEVLYETLFDDCKTIDPSWPPSDSTTILSVQEFQELYSIKKREQALQDLNAEFIRLSPIGTLSRVPAAAVLSDIEEGDEETELDEKYANDERTATYAKQLSSKIDLERDLQALKANVPQVQWLSVEEFDKLNDSGTKTKESNKLRDYCEVLRKHVNYLQYLNKAWEASQRLTREQSKRFEARLDKFELARQLLIDKDGIVSVQWDTTADLERLQNFIATLHEAAAAASSAVHTAVTTTTTEQKEKEAKVQEHKDRQVVEFTDLYNHVHRHLRPNLHARLAAARLEHILPKVTPELLAQETPETFKSKSPEDRITLILLIKSYAKLLELCDTYLTKLNEADRLLPKIPREKRTQEQKSEYNHFYMNFKPYFNSVGSNVESATDMLGTLQDFINRLRSLLPPIQCSERLVAWLALVAVK